MKSPWKICILTAILAIGTAGLNASTEAAPSTHADHAALKAHRPARKHHRRKHHHRKKHARRRVRVVHTTSTQTIRGQHVPDLYEALQLLRNMNPTPSHFRPGR